MLQSPLLARAPSLRRFLSYICEESFAGRADDLKEYSIAVEALGRPHEFDVSKDSIVRVEAHKLRKRLREYYEGEGADQEIVIDIPAGQYAPRFSRRDGAELKPAVAPSAGPAAAPAASPSPPADAAPANASSPRPRWMYWAAAACVPAVILAVGFFLNSSSPAPSEPVAAGVGDVLYRLTTGGGNAPYVDEHGVTWSADQFFEGGEATQRYGVRIESTPSPELYMSWREGQSFSYDLPLSPGEYQLALHFAELNFGPENPGTGESSRIFNVAANGEPILANFDVLSDGGRPASPVIKLFHPVAPDQDGVLHLDFQALSSLATLSGIEVSSTAGKPLPIRILAGDRKSPVVDNEEREWGPDRFFVGGRAVPRNDPLKSAEDPNLYSGERYGNFRYRIPVAAGSYNVRLRFAETWWGQENPGGQGVGSRIFDVFCNGKALLEDLDVYAEAGGENSPMVRSFSGIRPNAQGYIELAFVPKVNYAFVNALELLPE